MTVGRRLACTVAASLLVSGCTSGQSDPTAKRATTPAASPSSATSATTASVPPAPRSGACYRLRFSELAEPSNASRPVPCTARHNAQTIYVGRLATTVSGHAVAVDSDRVIHQLATECPRRLAGYVGGSPEDLDLSRFEVVWFSPTLEQGDLGADWFRCDLVAIAGKETLFPLPAPRRLKGVLAGPDAAAYGLCGTAAPGDPDFSRVICGRRHSWRAVATISIPAGKRYPGQPAARSSGHDTCRDRIRDRAKDPLKFQYGWEWPTGEQWRKGQHFGYCWAPD
ncbi:MAG: septum formation family protein [Nocardioides sp.]